MKKCIVLLLAALLFGFGGFFLGRESRSAGNETTEGNLHISVTVDYDAGFTTFPLEDPWTDWEEVSYLGITKATIDLDGTLWELGEAIQQGQISAAQVIALARLDASAGICYETWETENGLNTFTYHYPKYNLLYIYDAYETPDGRAYLISDFIVCSTGRSPSVFLYIDEKTGKPIDYEDWGITLEITQVSPDGITLECSQSGGQQMGDLVVRSYELCRISSSTGEETFISPLVEDTGGNIPLEMEGTAALSFDFAQHYGQLLDGDYVLYLVVDDQYSQELPSLMRNYYDEQRYSVPFSIS